MSRTLSVLILTPYAAPHTGGISTFVANLLVALRAVEGVTCHAIALSGEATPEIDACADSRLRFLFRSFEFITRYKPDVIHAQSHWYTLLPAHLARILGFRTRVVFSFHTMWPRNQRPRFGFILECLLNHSDVITFQSRALREQIENLLGIDTQVVCVYPGIELPPKALEAEVPASAPAFTIGYAGPLIWREKAAGLLALIDAMTLVTKEIPQVQLLVAGSGPYEQEARERVRIAGLTDQVRFLGNMPSLTGFWPLTEIYAHVSFQEGLPFALLEAMSHAKPVVANPVGGIPEVLVNRSNGILVDADPHSLAQVLTELLRSPELRERLGREARLTVEGIFGLKAFASRVLSAYGVDGEVACM